jgi:hypothetical protein
VQRAGFAGEDNKADIDSSASTGEKTDYEECLACQ